MVDGMTELLAYARTGLVSFLGERDPDRIADTLARYWYNVAVLGHQPGMVALRWAWKTERSGHPFPGCALRSGNLDAWNLPRCEIKDSVTGRRFLPPDVDASIREEVREVYQEVRTVSEREAVVGVLLSRSSSETEAVTGIPGSTVKHALVKLAVRCRKRRKARRRS